MFLMSLSDFPVLAVGNAIASAGAGATSPMDAMHALAMKAPGRVRLKNVRRLIALICSALSSIRVNAS
jgi:hypothetical protein